MVLSRIALIGVVIFWFAQSAFSETLWDKRTKEASDLRNQSLQGAPQPQPVEALVDQYISLIEQEKYREAMQVVEQIKEINPRLPSIGFMRKWAERFQGEPDAQERKILVVKFLEEIKTRTAFEGPSSGDPRGDICEAAYSGNLRKVEELLDKGVYVDAKDSFGQTALAHAVVEGHLDVMELLISRGADVNEPGFSGMTPLMMACASGRKDMVNVLISKGAKLNLKSETGATALSIAEGKGAREIVRILKETSAKEIAN